MNPLAQLATLIGGLCIFTMLRIFEVVTLAFYLVQWAAVPRWLEMIAVERSNSSYFQHDMANYWDNDEWYNTKFLSDAIGIKAMFHFANTIVYIFCLPSYLGLVLPFSCVPVFNLSKLIALDICACPRYVHGEHSKNEARLSCMKATLYAIFDLVFSCTLVPLACLQPLRGETCKVFFSFYREYVTEIYTTSSTPKVLSTDDVASISRVMENAMEFLTDVWIGAFFNGIMGTIEMVIYIFGFACILLTPTRYKSNFLDFSCLIGDYITDKRLITQALAIVDSPSYKSDFSAYQNISGLSEDYVLSLDTTYAIKLAAYCALVTEMKTSGGFWWNLKRNITDSHLFFIDAMFLSTFGELMVELVAIPATLAALISPIRSGKFRAEIAVRKELTLEKMRSMEEGEGKDLPETNDSILALTAFSDALNERGYLTATTRNAKVHRSAHAGTLEYGMTYFYRSTALRYIAIKSGMYALFDILVLPLMLPLIITQYRWGAISGYIDKHAAVSIELLGIIVTQTMCMTFDLIFLFPISLILYITRLRWRPLRDAYRETNFVASFEKSWSIYAAAFECFMRLLLDVLFLPGFTLIQLTVYRSEKVNYLFAHPYEFHTSKYFYFLFINTVMVVLDIMIIIPIVIVTIVFSGGLRAEAMYRLLQMCSIDTTIPTDHEPTLNPSKWLGDLHPAGRRMEESVQEEAQSETPLPTNTNESSRINVSGMPKSGEAPVGMEEERSDVETSMSTKKLIADEATTEVVTDGNDEVYNMFWACGLIPRYQKPACGQGPLSFTDWKNERYEKRTALTDMLVFPDSAIQARFAMLQQCFYAIFGTLFTGIALVIILSLWRAQKLINYYTAIRERRRVHYNSVFMERRFIDRPPGPNGYISPTFEQLKANLDDAEQAITGWNVLIMSQFFFLVLDVLALPAFAVVAGTLYRLPALLLELAARAGTAALSKRPLFKLTRLKFMFPRKGGPKMTMRMIYNTTPSIEDDATVLRDDVGNIRLPQRMNIFGPIKLYVSDVVEHEGDGLGFWQEVSNEYGSTLASIGEAMLPLKLKDGTGVELTEFQVALEELLFLNTQPGHTNHEIEMVANIDAGNTKRATFAKKLSKLTSRFSVQFQAACSIDGAKADDEVLFRMTLDPRVLSSAISGDVTGLDIVDATSTTATAGALVEIPMYGKFTSEGDGAFAFSSASEALATTQQRLEGGIARENTNDPECSRDNGLVDSFFLTVFMHCGKVFHDLAHLLLFLVTVIAPWRLFGLLMDLWGPVHLATHRKVVRAQELLDIAEQYLFDYYRALMPRFNSLSKARTEWDGGMPGTLKTNSFYWRYKLRYILPRLAFSDSDMQQDEALSITPYAHLTKQARKLLEDIDEEIPGVTRLLALHEETATLHDQVISIPALKATLYSYALANADDDFWSNGVDSREHNIIDTLLNTRTSVNRSIMVQNRRSTKETIEAIRAGCELAQKRKERTKMIMEYRTRNGIVDDTDGGEVVADVAAESEDGYWVVDGREVCPKSVSTLRGAKLADTKKLVRAAATNAWLDILYMLMAFFMFVSVVRFLPLLTDLCSIGTWNPGHYKVKFYIRKHVKIMADDITQLLLFFFLLAVVAATVFALPTTLLELPRHMSSLRDANEYLKHNLNNLCYYMCTLFIECCQCQTLWSVLNLGFFAGLTPGICLSDTLFPRPAAEEEQMIKETINEENEWARKLRCREDMMPSERKRHSAEDEKKLIVPFFFGCAIWAGLAFAAGWGTKLAMDAGEGSDGASDTASSNYFALVTYCTMAGLIVCVVFYSWNRKTLWQPVMLNNAKLNPFPSLTSSHISAILTGPMEALQLSAIACYFLWPTTTSDGQATWAARLLLWGDYSSSFSYHTSMNVAIAMGLGWLVVVTLPALIVGGNTSNPCEEDCCECGSSDGCCSCGCGKPDHEEYDKSLSVNQKANRLRSSPVFSLAYQLINRIFNVYFIATLLRPLSCMVVDVPSDGSSSGNVASSVITTTVRYAFGDAQNVEDLSVRASDVITCGGDGSFSSTVSGVCLMYYVITTLCTHADDGDSFSVSLVDISTQCYVRFCPSYAMILRALQMGSVVLVMMGAPLYSSTKGSQSILLVLGALALLMALVPLILYLRGVSTCSFESITPFRVFSSLSFVWTCTICYMRHAQPSAALGGTDSMWYLLAGWGALLLVGAVLSSVHYLGVVRAWRKEFSATPLYVAVEKLFSASTDNSLTMLEREEAAFLHDSSSSRGKAAGAAAESDNAGERDSAFEARAYSLAAVRAGLPEARKQALMKEAESATSIAHLAVVVAKFEDRILTERLDPAFLLYRDQWKKKLLNLNEYQNTDFASTEIGSRLASMWTAQSMANKSELMVELCTELCKAVIPPSHLLSTNQATLQAIFARKRIPLDCSYIILSYLVDTTKIKAGLLPEIEESLQIPGHLYTASTYDGTITGNVMYTSMGHARVLLELATSMTKSNQGNAYRFETTPMQAFLRYDDDNRDIGRLPTYDGRGDTLDILPEYPSRNRLLNDPNDVIISVDPPTPHHRHNSL